MARRTVVIAGERHTLDFSAGTERDDGAIEIAPSQIDLSQAVEGGRVVALQLDAFFERFDGAFAVAGPDAGYCLGRANRPHRSSLGRRIAMDAGPEVMAAWPGAGR